MSKNKIRKLSSRAVSLLLAAVFLFPALTGNINASGRKLIPLGRTTGIKMFSGGAVIVGFASSDSGGRSPAEICGFEKGDVILAVNGRTVRSNEELSSELASLSSDSAEFSVNRSGKEYVIEADNLLPNPEGGYRLSAWVRDSIAGIGTITYVDPHTGNFGSLGHGICDSDTGKLMPFDKGSVMSSEITGVVKGEKGSPGQLSGTFDLRKDSGILFKNTHYGIFGNFSDKEIYQNRKSVEVLPFSQVKCGSVEILSNVQGDEVQSFSAEIIRILDTKGSRNFMIEITDKRLLDLTGGIVQGMSGSPIIQDGKLVGAVTHVLVNDPTRGYGIFIENMLEAAE